MGLLDRTYRFGEGAEFLRLDLIEPRAEATGDAKMAGMFEFYAGSRSPIAAVFNVMRKAALAGVEIDRGYTLSGLEQRDSNVHSRSRLSGTAFFVAKDDDMRRIRLAKIRLHQHGLRNLCVAIPFSSLQQT
jgi:hypothetical protein